MELHTGNGNPPLNLGDTGDIYISETKRIYVKTDHSTWTALSQMTQTTFPISENDIQFGGDGSPTNFISAEIRATEQSDDSNGSIEVTLYIKIKYTTVGTAVQTVVIPLPADLPLPTADDPAREFFGRATFTLDSLAMIDPAHCEMYPLDGTMFIRMYIESPNDYSYFFGTITYLSEGNS